MICNCGNEMREYRKGFSCEGRDGCGRWMNNEKENEEIMLLLGKWQNDLTVGDDSQTRKVGAVTEITLLVRSMREGEKLTIKCVGSPEIYKVTHEYD